MAMQLRSGRHLASPVPVPAPGGDLRRVRPRHNQDGGDYDGKDLISDLPKDMRLEVLARLRCTPEAMRTSVLSKPWRRLWTELCDLTFDNVSDLDSLLRALDQVQPKLNRLCIQIPGDLQLGGASISSLLDAVDRLEPVKLIIMLCTEHHSAPFVLPCFARATSMELCMPGLDFTLPLTGSLASLEELTLFGGSIVNPGVFLPRCPRLRSLRMDVSCPFGANNKVLVAESSSLQELGWHLLDMEQTVNLHVVAPNLSNFVFKSFSSNFTMSMSSAPKLEDLYLEYSLEDSAVGCAENERWHLYNLKLEWPSNRDGSQQQHILSLYIDNVMVIEPVERSIEQEVARLPVTLTHFSTLELHLQTEGHVFGALVLQLLQMRTDIQRLKVILVGVDTECWESCDCDLASNWRNEPISLPCLEMAQFRGFRGRDHEIDFLKLLVGSAPSLNKMIVKHSNKISTVRGACKKLRNMFSTNASVKFSFS